MTGKMKFREVKNEERPVKREDLNPGDMIERYGAPCVICPRHFAEDLSRCHTGIVAVHIGSDGWTDLSDTSPSYRIHNIRQFDNGGFTWDRVCPEPEPVELDDLEDGEPFVTAGGWLCRRHQENELRYGGGSPVHSISLTDMATWSGTALRGDSIYRVEFCGFDKDTREILWRRI